MAGHILLENGAEIYRVEETIDRICGYYGVNSENAFVLSNGIFLTAGSARESFFAKVQHIPVSGTHLNKVAAVNQLSREIVEGKHTIQDAYRILEEIRTMPGKKRWMQTLASGVGSAAFCIFFGGTFGDSLAAFAAGICLYLYVLWLSVPHLSKIVGNIGGGALVTVVCCLLYLMGVGENLNYMINRHDHAAGAGSGVYELHPGRGGRRLHIRFSQDAGCAAGIFLHCHRCGNWLFPLFSWFREAGRFRKWDSWRKALEAGPWEASRCSASWRRKFYQR